MWLVNKHRELNSGMKEVTAANPLPDKVLNEVHEIISAGESNHSFTEILKNIISYSAEQIEADEMFYTKYYYPGN